MMADPFEELVRKLATGHNAVLQVVGDSTSYGVYDAEWWTKFGWAGRLALAIGNLVDCSVQVKYWLRWKPAGPKVAGSARTGSNSYSAPITTRVASSPAPTLTLMLGSIPGGTWGHYVSGIVSPDSDAIIIWNGFNEISTDGFTSGYTSFITSIRGSLPTVPIIAATENDTTISGESGHYWITFDQLFTAMIDTFLPGQALPLSPPLKVSTYTNDLWVLDSRQCNLEAANLKDGLHPIAFGYNLVAEWLVAHLVGDVPEDPGGGGEDPGGGGEDPGGGGEDPGGGTGGTFKPDSSIPPKIRLAGRWYEIKPRAKIAGAFKEAVKRH